MKRYHKTIYTEPRHWERLGDLTNSLNSMNWKYTEHCIDHIKSRAVDLEGLLKFIKDIRLEVENIFEYYIDDKGEPIKICYRIHYPAGNDIILVVGNNKQIITVYLNSTEDKHETLKRELYING